MKKLAVLLQLCLLVAVYPPLFAQVRTCIDMPALGVAASGAQNGVYDYNARWTNGAVIKVAFRGGSTYMRSKVMQYAKMWEQHANVQFDFDAHSYPDILIAFEAGKGSWSYIGTNCRHFAGRNQPSMNFGWFDDRTPDYEFKRTVLHEFGHALGLLHEHKNPYGDIKWNLPVVYNRYQAMGWTVDQIKEQVLSKYSVSLSNHHYDPASIMHYPIDASLTLDGYSVDWNNELSSGDKKLIGEMYPKRSTGGGNRTGTAGAASCTLEDLEIEHNTFSGGLKGMKILLTFTINNALNSNCLASAYFYYADGAPLKDYNSNYRDMAGNIASSKSFTPPYSSTKYTKLEVFMPYDEIEMSDGEHKLKLAVSIWNGAREELIQSGAYYFTYTKGIICNDLDVLTNFDNSGKQMFVMPKFTVQNAQNIDCLACVYFYNANESKMLDNYGNHLSYCQTFRPAYGTTLYNNNYYSDLYMTVPYSAINIPYGTHNIKYFVALFNNNKQFATSKWFNTTFSR